MSIILLIIVGAAAGYLATRLMDIDADMPTTIAVGIFGALIGGLVLRFLLMITGLFAGLIGAILGAMLLLWLWRTYFGR